MNTHPPHYRLLAIHAHPDDESSKGAATMARYAEQGHEVMVLTCTGGERGDILNPDMDKPGIHANIQSIRKQEMADAAAILGISHRWLGYVDSGLPEGDPLPPLPDSCFAREDSDEVTQQILKIVRDFRPHVVITYDEYGGYPHPDHLKVHEVSMRVWDTAGDPTYHPELGVSWEIKKLYYTHGFVKKRYEELLAAVEQRGIELSGEIPDFLDKMEDVYPRVTTRVPVADWFDKRDAALRAHATQIDPQGPFFAIPLELQKEVWPTEEFELALSRVEGLRGTQDQQATLEEEEKSTVMEEDLFAGLD